MPRRNPTMSYTLIRNYTEKFRWDDPKTGSERKGFNPPTNAWNVERIPFFIRFITGKGKVISGTVVCIGVETRFQQRRIKFVDSGEVRMVRDYLVIEVDGTRFITH